MNDLIKKTIDKVTRNRHLYEKGKAEFAVRDHLINPILLYFGWDTADPDYVIPNYRTENNDEPDYTLRKNEKTLTYVEAKSLDPKIKLKDHIGQLARYCSNKGVLYGILTNGIEWILLKSFEEGKSINDNIIWHINLEKDYPNLILSKLKTISYDNIENINELIKRNNILDKIMDKILSKPSLLADSIINIIKQELGNIEIDNIEIENHVHDKLELMEMLFQKNDDIKIQKLVVSEFTNKAKKQNTDGHDRRITAGEFIHKGNGIFYFDKDQSITLNANCSGSELEEQLGNYGLTTQRIGSFHYQLRNRSKLLKKRKR